MRVEVLKDMGGIPTIALLQESRMLRYASTVFEAVTLGVIAIGFIGLVMSFFSGVTTYQSILSMIALIVVLSYVILGTAYVVKLIVGRMRGGA